MVWKLPPCVLRKAIVIVLLVISVSILTKSLQLASTRVGRTSGPHTKGVDPSQDSNPNLRTEAASSPATLSTTSQEYENVLFDDVRRFIRTSVHQTPELMFTVLTKDKSSWGQEIFKPVRTFYDFFGLVNATGVDLDRVSLGLMTSSEEEYKLYKEASAKMPFARVTILFRPSSDDRDPNWWTSIPRGGRHTHAIQMKRRMHVARLRNELMAKALRDEEHLVWIDSDIQYLSPGMIQTMINHSKICDDASIITARCESGWNPDYDANSWAGARKRNPATGKTAKMPVDESNTTQKHIGELIKGTGDADIVHLDSVGGTILYIRASLISQGLSFPPYNVIGTTWGGDGWDGLETEGICYIARHLRGGGCYVLGGDHYVKHTSN